jgi:Fe-S-cluster containining protein
MHSGAVSKAKTFLLRRTNSFALMEKKNYQQEFIECRAGCGACCIMISISSPIPGMPEGKLAGVRCLHLLSNGYCALFGKQERPKVCSDFQAERAICGDTTEEAMKNIADLEGLNSFKEKI